MHTIYTIGHSTRSIEEFLALLKAHELTPFLKVQDGKIFYPGLWG